MVHMSENPDKRHPFISLPDLHQPLTKQSSRAFLLSILDPQSMSKKLAPVR